ncbi:hypothetical protein J6590_060759 [Homalodisca vitripennis]|nr:hypothetical protein J6590_060759 [Homalodisca vitripennis]
MINLSWSSGRKFGYTWKPPCICVPYLLSRQVNDAPEEILGKYERREHRLSQDNQIKQRRAWLLLGLLTAERSCPCKQPACPAIGGGSEVTFKPLVLNLSVREGFLALISPGAGGSSIPLGFLRVRTNYGVACWRHAKITPITVEWCMGSVPPGLFYSGPFLKYRSFRRIYNLGPNAPKTLSFGKGPFTMQGRKDGGTTGPPPPHKCILFQNNRLPNSIFFS